MSKESVLKVENVTMQFGGVIAVDNMNLEVKKGEIVSLIDRTVQARRRLLTSSPASMRPPTGRFITKTG